MTGMSTKRIKIEVYQCRCVQCGHEWTTKELSLPRRCPNHACRSVLWNAALPTRKKSLKSV
jgi:predicted Zn-ribbon and HTH transcriptional regulator